MTRPARKRASRKPLLAISAAAALAIANQAFADTLWTASTADWNSPANWSAGLPSSTINADINNSGTAQIATESVSAEVLTLGSNTAQAGALQILDGATLSTAGEQIGYNGTGSITQTDGTNAFSGNILLGDQPGSTGTYNLSGGSLQAGTAPTGSEYTEYIGNSGTGTFTQTGGTNAAQIALNGSGATYNLQAGTLTAQSLVISSGSFTQTAGTLNLDNYEQSGGQASFPSLTVTNGSQADLELGTLTAQTITVQSGAVFQMFGGALNCVTFNLNGGTAVFPEMILDTGAPVLAIPTPQGVPQPTINQNGGTIEANNIILGNSDGIVAYTLTAASAPLSGSMLFIANSTKSVANLTLSGGTLTPSAAYVGYLGNGTLTLTSGSAKFDVLSLGNQVGSTGTIIQSGGTVTLGSLDVGYGGESTGIYYLSGSGIIQGNGTEIIGYDGVGTFNQSGGSNSCSNFNIEDGGTYNLTGTGTLSITGGCNCAIQRGSFVQSGGIVISNATLFIGPRSSNVTSALYMLTGNGSLTDSRDEIVGSTDGVGFSQSGGTNSARNLIVLGGDYAADYAVYGGNAIYNMSGGADNFSRYADIGGILYPIGTPKTGTGQLNISGGSLSVAGTLTLFSDPGDQINLTGGNLSVGTLALANVQPYIFLNAWTAGTLTITGTNGFSISPGAVLGNSLELAQGQTLSVAHLLRDDGGVLALVGGNATVGGISGSGTTTIGTASALEISPHSPASSQSALTITGTGVMDITDNTFAINYGAGNPSPSTTIGSYIATGYNNGNWNGPGIISSQVAATNALLGNSHAYGIGYADASDPSVASDHFTPGTVIIEPALVGDANLDGVVDYTDFQILAANFNGDATSWDQGNFNYGPGTTYTDFQLLAGNFNDSTSLDNAQFDAMNALALSHGQILVANPDGDGFSFLSVPEPDALGISAFATLGWLSRRKRK